MDRGGRALRDTPWGRCEGIRVDAASGSPPHTPHTCCWGRPGDTRGCRCGWCRSKVVHTVVRRRNGRDGDTAQDSPRVLQNMTWGWGPGRARRAELSSRRQVWSAAPRVLPTAPAGTAPGRGRGRAGGSGAHSPAGGAHRAVCRGDRARGDTGDAAARDGGTQQDVCRALYTWGAWCSSLGHRAQTGRSSHRSMSPSPSQDTGNTPLGGRQRGTCGSDSPESVHSSGHRADTLRGSTYVCTGVGGSCASCCTWSHTDILYDTASSSGVFRSGTPSPPPVGRFRSFRGDTSWSRCVCRRSEVAHRCLRRAARPQRSRPSSWFCRRDRSC